MRSTRHQSRQAHRPVPISPACSFERDRTMRALTRCHSWIQISVRFRLVLIDRWPKTPPTLAHTVAVLDRDEVIFGYYTIHEMSLFFPLLRLWSSCVHLKGANGACARSWPSCSEEGLSRFAFSFFSPPKSLDIRWP
jgi:hypothetical protein